MKYKQLLKYIMENEKIVLEEPRDSQEIESFAQLINALLEKGDYNIDDVLNVVNDMDFIEDTETIYLGSPVKVRYIQLPAVIGDNVLIKVVLLTQADSLALIIPENVKQTRDDLVEDPDALVQKNSDISLYAEIYNFNQYDVDFIDLIKSTYLSSGNSTPAFDLKDKPVEEEEEEVEGGDDSNFDFTPPTDTLDDSFKPSSEGFDEIPDTTGGGFEELSDNLEAFKKFKGNTRYLESLLKHLYKISTNIFKANVRVKYLRENNAVLLIEVNNRNIYNKFKNIPTIAKKSLTAFGESIRSHKRTQLVDTFIKNGKRYFVVVENNNSNFWVVKNEAIDFLDNGKEAIQPIQDEIIKLNHSSIRKESRKIKPYIADDKIVFVRGN